MTSKENTVGVILAGGLSRRMDGNEKSLIMLGTNSLIGHVLHRLQPQVSTTIINANGDPARFANLDVYVQEDTVGGFVGPLAGVLAGMDWAQSNRPDATHILTAAADTPFFPETYAVEMFRSALSANAEIALASSNERHHPVFGLWQIGLRDELRAFLTKETNHKVMIFVNRFQNIKVNFEASEYDPFFNVNTPEDLKIAAGIWGNLT